jgi:hypothetical protein
VAKYLLTLSSFQSLQTPLYRNYRMFVSMSMRNTNKLPSSFFVMGVANGAHIPGKGNGRESFCREEIFFTQAPNQ